MRWARGWAPGWLPGAAIRVTGGLSGMSCDLTSEPNGRFALCREMATESDESEPHRLPGEGL